MLGVHLEFINWLPPNIEKATASPDSLNRNDLNYVFSPALCNVGKKVLQILKKSLKDDGFYSWGL